MEYFIGNTDREWFNYLRTKAPEDINFWQPGGKQRFHVIKQDAPFLLRLKSPINKIVGIGFFSSHSLLPIDFAWEVFQQRNGVDSLETFHRKINSYRSPGNSISFNPVIGCLILSNPIFFKEIDWLSTPEDWKTNIVQGKKYDSNIGYGKMLWKKIEFLLLHREYRKNIIVDEDSENRYGSDIITHVRLGQGAFRVLITDAYERKCAISGEKTLPVLDAAHIKPYDQSGPHLVSNGLLLRTDLHKLFDKGYLTITNDFKIEVSRRIKEEFENGRDYYKYHGNSLIILPSNPNDKPSQKFINWHNQNVFKG